MTRDSRLLPIGVLAALLVAAPLLAGCSNRGNVQEDPMAASDSITGTVRQVGSTPFTRIVVEGEERSMTITGALEEEIGRVVGARVRVVGAQAEADGPGPALEASGYEILSVDGETPRVGTLRHEAGEGYRLVTDDGESVSLRGVPDGLGAQVGARVWIVVGEDGAVQRYGILRTAGGTET